MKSIVKIKHILAKPEDFEVELLNAVQEMQSEGLAVDIAYAPLNYNCASAVISGYEEK